jgi:autotransporter-associated beta strand protein
MFLLVYLSVSSFEIMSRCWKHHQKGSLAMRQHFSFFQGHPLWLFLRRILLLSAAIVVAIPLQSVLAAPAQHTNYVVSLGTVNAPAAGGDITNLITANGGNENIVLTGGNYTITLPQDAPLEQAAPELPSVPTTTYNGVISGEGVITVQGSRRTLVLTNTSTYSLPKSQLKQSADMQKCAPYVYDGIEINGGDCHAHVNVVHGKNNPVLIINEGVTVHFSNQRNPSIPAVIMNVATPTSNPDPRSVRYNFANIKNNGVIVISSYSGESTAALFGEISGSGSLINHTGGFALSGTSTYTGSSIINFANINENTVYGGLPNTSVILNEFIINFSTPPQTYASEADINSGNPEYSPGHLVVPQDIYEYKYGGSLHNIGYGTVIYTGVYQYSDSGDMLHPSLSNPDLNYAACRAGNVSGRRLHLGHTAGVTQLGDGTTSKFFFPGNPRNNYIWLARSHTLSFNYNGPVTLNVPINRPDGLGGVFEAGALPGNVFILGTPGNHVIFTQPEYYNGITKIDTNAILQLGDGTGGNENPNFTYTSPSTGKTYRCYYSTSGGNSSLTTADSEYGIATDQVILNGLLIVDNVPNALDGVNAVSLSNISGSGSLTQQGTLPLTLLANTTYTGVTTITNGALILGRNASGIAGSIARSCAVKLTNAGATFDMTQAGDQTIQDLSGAEGSIISLGKNTLTVGTANSTTFAGTLTSDGKGGGVSKVGQGTLTLLGKATTASGPWQVRQGTLQMGDATHTKVSLEGNVTVLDDATLLGIGTITGPLSNEGSVSPGVEIGTLTVAGDYTQRTKDSTLAIQIKGGQNDQLVVSGKVSLGGTLTVKASGKLNVGDTYTLINNIGSSPITGTFAGLKEGATLTVDGTNFRISYVGGTGNDVVLTVVGGTNTIVKTHSPTRMGNQPELAGNSDGDFVRNMLIVLVITLIAGLVLGVVLLLRRSTAARAWGQSVLRTVWLGIARFRKEKPQQVQ